MDIETTNLFLHNLIKECGFLENGFIQKIQKTPQNWIKFKVNTVKGVKDFILTPKVFVLLEYKVNALQKPATDFTGWLNKQLKNQKIKRIIHSKKERVIELEFTGKTIAIELFAAGKILLLDKKNRVANGKSLSGKTACLKKNKEYKRLDQNNKISYSSIKKEVKDCENTAKFLAGRGVPAIITESMEKKFSGKDKEFIAKKAVDLFNQKQCKKVYLYEFKGKQVLLPMKLENQKKKQEFETATNAANQCFILPKIKGVETKKIPKKNRLKALKISLEKQKQKLVELKEQSEKNKKIAELIYENYGEIQKILQTAKKTKNKQIMYNLAFGRLKVLGTDLKEKKIKIESGN